MNVYYLIGILVLIFTGSSSGYPSGGAGQKMSALLQAIKGDLEEIMSEANIQQVVEDEAAGRDHDERTLQEVEEMLAKRTGVEIQQEQAEPLDWPAGTFSFPKPIAGCPPGFDEGCIFQNNQGGSSNANLYTPANIGNFLDGYFGQDLRLCYCTEQQAFSTVQFWPEGQYCLAKKGPCPAGFEEGSIYWDDANEFVNFNNISGVIPDGTYDTNTEIQYCCRRDGFRVTAIPLPTTHDFVLYPIVGGNGAVQICQDVQGMTTQVLEIRTDDDDDNNEDSCTGMHPLDINCDGPNHRVSMCHYTRIQ